MKVTYSVGILCLCLTFPSIAQERTGGVKAGVNLLSQKWIVGDLGDDNLNGTSFHIGLYGKFGIGDKAFFGPEVLYNSLKVSDGDDMTMGYISVPIMFLYEFQENVNIQAGPQLGFLLSTDPSEFKDQDAIKGTDFSFNLGAGYDFNAGNITFRYCIGLSNIAGDELQDAVQNGVGESLKIRNNVVQISLGLKLFGE